jgi:Pyruvate/2-oxoacid:ferredoxin oxidoreductase gamma subunit
MDFCGTAIAAGAATVYRTTAFEKDLVDTLADAISRPGFALVDTWELCSAYYGPRNKLQRKELYELLDKYGFKLGKLQDKERPEYSAYYWKVYKESGAGDRPVKRTVIEPSFTNSVKQQTGIVIAGSAGQKIKSSAGLFAQAAMMSGLQTTQKDDYPITVMTGHSCAEVIISPERIDYTGIPSPDVFIVISEDGLKRVKAKIGKLPDSCTLYADDTLELPETKAKVVRLPFLETAKKISKLSVAVVALGTALAERGYFPQDALGKAISTFQKPKIAEVNRKALEAGVGLVGAGK